ncbi:hypothetical protein BDK51DRAFT_35369 [Blyttiomyces helicus]|uniref:Uncharacterized protein n=1 Tax=Blyttiomyces helicus TaxID=388810 RepID=A0A4P9WIC2_9FUNG|nr:hypothetical protein BDK51DRAFT_35369 [Blyttiomyces helicus]|eukprot:RKO91188.1 hypothetical protein BDK51DRAFT_35369 [Blyttiomyces helicus]
MAKKVQNFWDTVNFVFPSHFDTDLPNPAAFTPDFLMTIHRYIGSNRLIMDAWSYRPKWLAPAKGHYVYLKPVCIPIELPRLCCDVRTALLNYSETCKTRGRICSQFPRHKPVLEWEWKGRSARAVLASEGTYHGAHTAL